MVRVPKIKLGSLGLEVAAQGIKYTSQSDIPLISEAINAGVTFLDTSNINGKNSHMLLSMALNGVTREKVELATNSGMEYNPTTMAFGDPDVVRAECEHRLKELKLNCIDLYYQTTTTPHVGIQTTMRALKEIVQEGKINYIGLTNVSASTIRRAHAAHPITAITLKWSLWARDVEKYIVPTCRELGIGIVAYGPLGRGFFSSALEKLEDGDIRQLYPWLQPEVREKNKIVYKRLNELASKKGCTPTQLSLAWVHHQGNDVVPIPLVTKMEHLEHNIGALSVKLTPEEMAELEAIVSADLDTYTEESLVQFSGGIVFGGPKGKSVDRFNNEYEFINGKGFNPCFGPYATPGISDWKMVFPEK